MTYNIYLVSRKTNKAVKLKRANVPERQLQDSILFGFRNLDTENYDVSDAEVGSEQDMIYDNQIANA